MDEVRFLFYTGDRLGTPDQKEWHQMWPTVGHQPSADIAMVYNPSQ